MEKIFEQALLYDFYGELLTEHQRGIYEEAVYNDMSLSEIAEEYGISRQGVHDLIRRCDRILQEYEARLHLVERFIRAKGKISEILELTMAEPMSEDGIGGRCDRLLRNMECIRELSEQLLQEL